MKKSNYKCTSCQFIYKEYQLICPICERGTFLQLIEDEFGWKSIVADVLLVIAFSAAAFIFFSLIH